MWRLLIILLIGAVIAGCSSQPSAGNSTQATPLGKHEPASIAPEGRVIEEIGPTETNPSLPVMTVNPPARIVTPIPGNSPPPTTGSGSMDISGWQTFTSPQLLVSVDYPGDWTAVDDKDRVTFTSPSGVKIELKSTDVNPDNPEIKIGNRYCSSRANQNHLTAEICADNASFQYTATFKMPSEIGTPKWITLSTQARAAGNVFEGMFDSVRLIK